MLRAARSDISDIVSPEGILDVSTVNSSEVDVRRQNQCCLKIGISVAAITPQPRDRENFIPDIRHKCRHDKTSLILLDDTSVG